MIVTLQLIAALVLDRLLGEPRRFHPLVGFGWLVSRLEKQLNRGQARILRGVFAWCLLIIPLSTGCYLLLSALPFWLNGLLSALILYLTIGLQSLTEHGRAVIKPLLAGDMAEARYRASMLVSRDPETLEPEKATLESVLENGSDCLFGAVFWFVLLGAPGALAYRLANTLDAMWGYRSERFNEFGRAAARIDDLLNYIPARLTALSYAALGATRTALKCWREQANACESPNAGPVMSAGAGALQIELGGAARYRGEWLERPVLGQGCAPQAQDIERACQLVWRSAWLWIAVIALAETAFFLYGVLL